MSIHVTDLTAKEVMQQIVKDGQEDGFFICDVSDIIEKYRNWQCAMPRIKPFYAMKANDVKLVLETLATLDTGFDCASMGEIQKILSLGVSPDRIIFANPTKFISHIKYASKVRVSKMTFDSEDELYKIKDVFPSAELVLRIRYDDPSAYYMLGKKHGAEPNNEARKLFTVAKSLNLNVMGVSFHIGSGSKDFTIYEDAIACARQVFNMGSEMGFKLELLDIGGGFPGYKNYNIVEIANLINQAVDEYFPEQSIQIISEPGKYFVDSAFTLATSIHTTKTIEENGENGKKCIRKIYYANQSCYQALMTIFYGEICVPMVLFNKPLLPVYPSIIWGTTLDVCDILSDTIDLPELKIGDWLYFENVGAYTICCSSEFNSFPTPDIYSIIKEEDWLYLTKDVNKPLPKDMFVFGNDPDDFRIGIKNT